MTRVPKTISVSDLRDDVADVRFFYRADDRKVWIVAVWHGAQLPDDPSR